MTLPEDVLERLAGVHADLGRAIVRLVEERRGGRRVEPPPAELSHYGKQAVILVKPARALKRLPGVELVPLQDGRALVSLREPHALAQLELDIRDVLDRDMEEGERRALESFAEILRQARLSPDTSLQERTIIVLETRRMRPSAGSGAKRPAAARVRKRSPAA